MILSVMATAIMVLFWLVLMALIFSDTEFKTSFELTATAFVTFGAIFVITAIWK